MELTLKSYIEGVESGKFSPEEVMKNYLERAKNKNEDYFAFLRFHEDYVDENLNKFKNRALK